MSFVDRIFERLRDDGQRPLVIEGSGPGAATASARSLLERAARARAFLRRLGARRGERCVLAAPNSIDWAAMDLAILAEGALSVPFYTRQVPEEMAASIRDCEPLVVLCGEETLRASLATLLPGGPPVRLLAEAFAEGASEAEIERAPEALDPEDPVALIYTSGTSGVAKGVVLTAGNLEFMLARTGERLDALLRGLEGRERIFHYLPFCFAGSWILLLSSLLRGAGLTLSTDVNRLAEEMRHARPHTMQNVPILLERIRAGVEQALAAKPAPIRRLFERAKRAHARAGAGGEGRLDRLALGAAEILLFRAVRRRIGPDLRALICGSAPLAGETQRFLRLLGIEVLQVYGLTETTAICTMDSPGGARVEHVGTAVAGVEMRRGDGGEILVRGPNVFAGYWRKPEETARAMRDGWFHTGDQGEVTPDGYWRIVGRVNHLIVLATGHNVAPEPIEERIHSALPEAKQVVVVGHRRKHLAALVTGGVAREQVERALSRLNPLLAPYQRVHAFHVHSEPFTIESGLLTANGKLRREAILSRFDREIESLYADGRR